MRMLAELYLVAIVARDILDPWHDPVLRVEPPVHRHRAHALT